MHAEAIVPGMRVRYPQTGTTGTVGRIEIIRGKTFAELDSTHLLYAVEYLIPAEAGGKERQAAAVEDAKKIIEKEREYAAGSELTEALKNIDQSCEGGG